MTSGVRRASGSVAGLPAAREDAGEFFAKLGFCQSGEITTPTTTPIPSFSDDQTIASLMIFHQATGAHSSSRRGIVQPFR